MADVGANYRYIVDRISAAAAKKGRDITTIKLLAAAKAQSSESIRAAIAAGVRLVGPGCPPQDQEQQPHNEHRHNSDRTQQEWILPNAAREQPDLVHEGANGFKYSVPPFADAVRGQCPFQTLSIVVFGPWSDQREIGHAVIFLQDDQPDALSAARDRFTDL